MRNKRPRITITQILVWAEAHLRQTGERPTCHSGPVSDAPGETWSSIHHALTNGYRGLPGGVSLVELFNRHWGKQLPSDKPPPLTIEQILTWAEAHHERTGKWPTAASGEVIEEPGETWKIINSALWEGHRGLTSGDSLSQLLKRHSKATSPTPDCGSDSTFPIE